MPIKIQRPQTQGYSGTVVHVFNPSTRARAGGSELRQPGLQHSSTARATERVDLISKIKKKRRGEAGPSMWYKPLISALDAEAKQADCSKVSLVYTMSYKTDRATK